MYPASITKVMTALIAIKYGNLQDQVTVTDDAVITETGATFMRHPTWRYSDFRAAAVWSDAPHPAMMLVLLLRIHMAGSIDAFADKMNEEARRLGATDTHFVNPHGLHDEDHYTTAYDLYPIF